MLDLLASQRKRRPYAPGQSGQARRPRISEYKKRLLEKQKIRFNYGVGERQLRRLFIEAKNSREPAGLILLRLLEQRLDNVIFRTSLAPTIPAARQLISHGHILVNEKKVNIPSFRVKPGDKISLREKSRKLEVIEVSLAQPSLRLPPYLSFESTSFSGQMVSLPIRDDIPIQVDEQLVVEYYAQRL